MQNAPERQTSDVEDEYRQLITNLQKQLSAGQSAVQQDKIQTFVFKMSRRLLKHLFDSENKS
jgi:hypothetical protein